LGLFPVGPVSFSFPGPLLLFFFFSSLAAWADSISSGRQPKVDPNLFPPTVAQRQGNTSQPSCVTHRPTPCRNPSRAPSRPQPCACACVGAALRQLLLALDSLPRAWIRRRRSKRIEKGKLSPTIQPKPNPNRPSNQTSIWR
jgi:hypothetical protein